MLGFWEQPVERLGAKGNQQVSCRVNRKNIEPFKCNETWDGDRKCK